MLRNSLALVSASMEEGFDYPVLEPRRKGSPLCSVRFQSTSNFTPTAPCFFLQRVVKSFRALGRLLADSRLWWDLGASGRELALSLSVTNQQRALNTRSLSSVEDGDQVILQLFVEFGLE